MKTSKQLREEIDALSDRVEAIVSLATEEDRDLTDDENREVDSIQGAGDDAGQIGKLQAELDRISKIEARQAAIAASRVTPSPDGNRLEASNSDRVVPAVARRHGKLLAFSEEFDAYASGQFLRATIGNHSGAQDWCNSNGIDIKAAMKESDNSKGGYLVPAPMEMSIIRLVEEYGVFRRYARNYPMSSETDSAPRREGGITVYFPGEGSSITASDMEIGSVELVAKKMAALTKMTSELDEDAVIAIADLLATEIAYGFANKEDDCGFNGDGTSTYGGITGLKSALQAGSIVDAASGNTTFATLDLADFEACIGNLPMFPGIQPAWYIHKTGWSLSMSRLANAAGGNTNETYAGGASETMFLGYPVRFAQILPSTDAVSTIQCYFGDLGLSSTLGVRRGVTISADSSRYFEEDNIAIKGTQRVAINNHERGDATNAGPMIGLKTAAS